MNLEPDPNDEVKPGHFLLIFALLATAALVVTVFLHELGRLA